METKSYFEAFGSVMVLALEVAVAIFVISLFIPKVRAYYKNTFLPEVREFFKKIHVIDFVVTKIKNRLPKGEKKTAAEKKDEEEHPSYFLFGVLAWTLFVFLINFFYVFPYWSLSSTAKVVGFVLTVWVGDAITILEVNEFCGLTLFGRRVTTFGPGLYLFPRLLFKRYIFKSDIYEIYWPAKQDEIFHGLDEQLVPAGLSRAWRFLTGAPNAKGNRTSGQTSEEVSFSNILDVQQFVSLSGFTAWQIQRERLFDLILASGGKTSEVEDQIFSITFGHLTSQVSKYTISKLNQNLQKIAKSNEKEIQKVLGEKYGVKIITHTINPPNISHGLAEAQRDANKARAAAVKTKTEADAEKYRLIRVGEGDGQGDKARIKGEGEGIKDASDLLDMSPEAYYAGRVAKDTLGEGDVTVLGTESIGNMVSGIASSLLRGVTGKKTKKENTDTSGGGKA